MFAINLAAFVVGIVAYAVSAAALAFGVGAVLYGLHLDSNHALTALRVPLILIGLAVARYAFRRTKARLVAGRDAPAQG